MCEIFMHRVPICWGEGIEVLTSVWGACLGDDMPLVRTKIGCLLGQWSMWLNCSDENQMPVRAMAYMPLVRTKIRCLLGLWYAACLDDNQLLVRAMVYVACLGENQALVKAIAWHLFESVY